MATPVQSPLFSSLVPVMFRAEELLSRAIKVNPKTKSTRRLLSLFTEEGTTTTPYSMLRLNGQLDFSVQRIALSWDPGVGRFDVAEAAIRCAAANSTKLDTDAHVLITYFQHQNRIAEKFALENGEDDAWFEGGE